MHPDVIITGLRHELDRLNPAADDYVQRRAEIEREIAHHDGRERPEVKAEDQNTIADPNVGYLKGLKRELATSARERRDEIKAEIERVEELIHDRKGAAPAAVAEPVAEADVEDAEAGSDEANAESPEADEAESHDADEAGDDSDGDGDEGEDDPMAYLYAADFEESHSRRDLNEIADGLGVPDPDKLQNKGAVVDAIREAAAK